ncbi:MAG: hypothetical protein LBB24_03295 [Rickettsiales bacterium]|jgi:D-alanine--D-alanine ligase|nr:hypothetical protein [Rickettsiales bacterium]
MDSNLGISSEPIGKASSAVGTRGFVVAIVCGGPSLERGISLNSARSVVDHLESKNIGIRVLYINRNLNFFSIDKKQLYSNTPSDFDFKLSDSSNNYLSESDFIDELKSTNIVFPLIHGSYGEDGKIQWLLEKNNIPFIGSGSVSCKSSFDKIKASTILSRNGFYMFPFIYFIENGAENKKIIERFFELNRLKKAVVKPAYGGSSIGVHCVYSDGEALEKVRLLFEQGNTPVIVEPFCVGREFTVIVIRSARDGQPVALTPTEIEMKYENYQIFDYRRKYLPTSQTRFYTPARFREEEIEKIMRYSEEIFGLLELDDIVRIDGWLLNDGRIWFSDINIASGMEQNSFVFQQSARIGMTHNSFLKYLLSSTCRRYSIECPTKTSREKPKKVVNVLFGSHNAERQISLMSGTNVWLKLLKSEKYSPKPYILDKNGDVWYLPYPYTLNHTVEEIYENITNTDELNLEKKQKLVDLVCPRLGLEKYKFESPIRYSFNEFIGLTKRENAFVFIGLHGGMGENGTLQEKFDKNGIRYNGSGANASRLCMDKYATGELINSLRDDVLVALPKIRFGLEDLRDFSTEDYANFFDNVKKNLDSTNFILKPCSDGSSAGVVEICSADDLRNYVDLLRSNVSFIPTGTFKNQTGIVEMPSNSSQYFLLESFLDVDKLVIRDNKIIRHRNSGWLELTVGVLESGGVYHSLNPSITVAEGKILTVEEKFQGGTGINITPPPTDLIAADFIAVLKASIERAAKALNIENYARLDIFVNQEKNRVVLIEANTLPGLTPSTVIFHQALAEDEPMVPEKFIEKIIEMKE